MSGGRWDPWEALYHAADVVLVEDVSLAGPRGLAIVFPDGEPVIALDPTLGRVERRCVLAHELVHLERGLLPRWAAEHVRANEERLVDGEAARRLVPEEELLALAAHFDVTSKVLGLRVDGLRPPRRR